MLRKITFALVAAGALGAAALAPIPASARGHGGGFHAGAHGGWAHGGFAHRGWGHRGFAYRGWGRGVYGYGGGPGWCYYHPYRCR